MEAFVTHWFPQKHQLVAAGFACYVGTYGLYKFLSGNPKPQRQAKPAPTTAPSKAAAHRPGEFAGPRSEADLDRWAADQKNWSEWEKWMAQPGALESWEKTLR